MATIRKRDVADIFDAVCVVCVFFLWVAEFLWRCVSVFVRCTQRAGFSLSLAQLSVACVRVNLPGYGCEHNIKKTNGGKKRE